MTKRIVFAAAAFIGFNAANAQEGTSGFGFSKGNILVEGNIGFNSQNDENTKIKTSGFGFNPSAGYFVTDDLAVGVELSIGSGSTIDSSVSPAVETKNSNFGGGVFGRYYFFDLNRVRPYAQAGLGYTSSKTETTGLETKLSGVNFGAGVGASIFITECVAVNVHLANVLTYSSQTGSTTTTAGGTTTTTKGKPVSDFGFNAGTFNNPFALATFGITLKF